MKKLNSLHLIMFLATTLFTAELFAQDESYKVIASYNEERPLPKYLTREPANYPAISSKALLAFQKNFGNVSEVKWSLAENNYMAQFFNQGRKTRVMIDKKGYIVYSIAQGTIKSLPAETRKTVRSVYYDYDITLVTEVQTLGKTAWLINLEDETSIVTVRVMDGEITETGHYRKSK